MRPLRTLAIGLALLVTLAACADSTETGAEPDAVQPGLAGSSWILTEVSVDGEMTAAVDSSGSLTFEADGSLFGSTGCNRFNGTWSAEDGGLLITTGGQTLIGCPEQLQTQENALLAALSATRGYTIADDVLTLTDEQDAQLATYTAAVVDLAGTSWRATGVNNGAGGVVTTAATAQITVQFDADGTLTGFAGCTPFSGSYTTDGAAIAITGLQEDQPCADAAAADQQAEYLAALAAATNFSIDGNRLDLRDESGALQVGFTSA